MNPANRITIKGLVQDDRQLKPIADVSVLLQLNGDKARTLDRSTTDEDGHFGFMLAPDDLNESWQGSASLWLLVTTPDGRALFSTRDTTLLLRGTVWDVTLTIPHERIASLQQAAPVRPSVRVGAFDLDAQMLAELEQEDLLYLARMVLRKEVPPQNALRIERLHPDLLPARSLEKYFSLTPVFRTIDGIIRHKKWPRAFAHKVRQYHTTPAEDVKPIVHECDNFVVTYYLEGPARVDPDDSSQPVAEPGEASMTLMTLPAGGAPTYIKRLCFWLERALSTYTSPPFGLKNPALAGRIPVTVLDVDIGGVYPDGMSIDNNLPPDLLASIVSHEVFHLVQQGYVSLYAGPWGEGLLEGSAVAAEDAVVDRVNRYLFEATTIWGGVYGALQYTNQSLFSMSHDSGFFWRYFVEQHSPDLTRPLGGVETYRTLLGECEKEGSCTTFAIRETIRSLPWYQEFYGFGYLDPGKDDLLSAETTLGNYALACILKDLGALVPDRRFTFIESENDILWDEVFNAHDLTLKCPETDKIGPVQITASATLTASKSKSFSGEVNSFASQYYVVQPDSAITNVDVEFSGVDGQIFQIALVNEDGTVRDIHRSDRARYSKRLVRVRDGMPIQALLMVVTGCEAGGEYTISLNPASPSSDVMVTRWNTRRETEYEIDSFFWSWTWVSPDIWVDNDGDNIPDDIVHLDADNRLHVRLHNKGNADASNIVVEFFYQDASGSLSPTGWLPVVDTSGTVQVLTGLSLGAGQSRVWSVNWCPRASGTSRHFCVRVVLTVPGDPNADNKRAMSNFGNVTIQPGRSAELEALRRNPSPVPLPIDLEVISRLPPELTVSRQDVQEQQAIVLGPGETRADRLLVFHLGRREEPGTEHPSADHGHLLTHEPLIDDVQAWCERFNIPPDALPPHVAGKALVTLVHKAKGVVTGGVTFQIVPEPRK